MKEETKELFGFAVFILTFALAFALTWPAGLVGLPAGFLLAWILLAAERREKRMGGKS